MNSLFESGGYMWFGSADGRLYQMNISTGTFISYDVFSHSPNDNVKEITKIIPVSEGRLFIGTTAGIKLFDTRTGTYADILRYNPDKTTVYVHNILQAGPSEYWFGTETGIYIYNILTGAFTYLTKNRSNPYSLSDNAVHALCKDKEGGIWAGTKY